MAKRIPQGLRWTGGIAVTAWAAAKLTVIATAAQGGDISIALYFGVACLVLAALLEWRPIQTRIPFLTPDSCRLAKLIHDGHLLIDELRRGNDNDDGEDGLLARSRRWRIAYYETVERVGDQGAPHLRSRETWDISDFAHCEAFLEHHVARLEELLREQR